MNSTMKSDPRNEFEVSSSIPVLRMLDEGQAKDYYINYLGFKIDWEHRFSDSPSSPLYMQIHLGDAVIHLNGHADQDAPVAEVRIPVRHLENYCEFLRSKQNPYSKPTIVDPRYKGKNTDMNMIDPSGNYLVFWLLEDE